MRSASRDLGFTLIELLVAIAVLAIFFVAILGLLDSSQRVAKSETALADVQENVRYAAYHLLRTARMVGASNMPFAQDVSGTPYWLAAWLRTDQSSFTDDLGNTRTSVAHSDVLVLRGFFEKSPYFVKPGDVDTNGGVVTVRENVGAGAGAQDMDVAPDEFVGLGLVLMGRGQYAVAQVLHNSAPAGTTPSRTFTITYDINPPAAPWLGLNPNATYTFGTGTGTVFDLYRVGVLDSYTYYVSAEPGYEFQLTRVRGSVANPIREPVAINIGSLQCALGVDTNGDGTIDSWFDQPAHVSDVIDIGPPLKRPIAIRITVLGRTVDTDPNWSEPVATVAVEDLLAAQVDVHAKWRRMQVTATLRDFVL